MATRIPTLKIDTKSVQASRPSPSVRSTQASA